MRLQRRTRDLAAEYQLWYDRPRPEGTELDPAEVGGRLRALRDGRLGPAATAKALRDAADVVDARAAACLETIARIDAEYGEVFRRVSYVSGEYLAPYERLLATQGVLERSRRLAPRLRSLADRHERRAARRWPPPGGLIGPPDIAALLEAGDKARLLRALDHRNEDIRIRAASALSELGAPEVVDVLLGIIDDARQGVRPPSKKLHEAAVRILATTADPRAADALVRHAREHLGRDEGTSALTGLVRMKDERTLDLLVTHLRDGYVANSATRLLADLGDPRAIPVLRDYISELEGSAPKPGAESRLRDLYLDAARSALARLDPNSAAPGDG
ncbi:hypothetical protein [Actinomadura sp. B10D3]|uniref:HEAT repeat domain-containing protein n=1 Tax=Actinomadura sp. B10D3 TaxID=3153557 RepID=UPI00325DE2EF